MIRPHYAIGKDKKEMLQVLEVLELIQADRGISDYGIYLACVGYAAMYERENPEKKKLAMRFHVEREKR